MKNYYAILGISLFATEAEIRRAMRRKAERQEIDLETLNECREHLLLVVNRRLYNEQVREHFPLFFKQCNEIFRQENAEKVKKYNEKMREENPFAIWFSRIYWGLFIYYGLVAYIYNMGIAPFVAVYKSKNPENIKITCAYINPRKAKYDYNIIIDSNNFLFNDITNSYIKRFPIDYKRQDFLNDLLRKHPDCIMVKYIQIPALYPTFIFNVDKKIYLYDYVME